jgi:uncharacterized protein YehS (DUF1456 family)
MFDTLKREMRKREARILEEDALVNILMEDADQDEEDFEDILDPEDTEIGDDEIDELLRGEDDDEYIDDGEDISSLLDDE